MPQIIGRGEAHRVSASYPAPGSRLLDATLAVIASWAGAKVDSRRPDGHGVQFSTPGSLIGWGEILTVSLEPDLPGTTRLVLTVTGRHRGGVLQPQRNRRLAERFMRELSRALDLAPGSHT